MGIDALASLIPGPIGAVAKLADVAKAVTGAGQQDGDGDDTKAKLDAALQQILGGAGGGSSAT